MIEQGLTVMRVENESQQKMAVMKPRDEAVVYSGALKELELAPEFAKRAWYAIPYKDGDKVVNVEGPSIKAAMALARRWGNCANGGRVVENLDDRIIVEGVFLDYETNLRTMRTVSVAKRFWSKKTNSVIPLRDDRLNMAIQSGMSKAIRNAILSSIPASLVDAYVAHAKKVAAAALKGNVAPGAKPKTAKEQIEASIRWFVAQGAADKSVREYLDGLGMETDDDILTHIIGLGTAIRDGQTNIEEVFGKPETATSAPAAVPSVGDLLGGEAKK
jgi:hypothetical protein